MAPVNITQKNDSVDFIFRNKASYSTISLSGILTGARNVITA